MTINIFDRRMHDFTLCLHYEWWPVMFQLTNFTVFFTVGEWEKISSIHRVSCRFPARPDSLMWQWSKQIQCHHQHHKQTHKCTRIQNWLRNLTMIPAILCINSFFSISIIYESAVKVHKFKHMTWYTFEPFCIRYEDFLWSKTLLEVSLKWA